ncbi:MAG: SNARE-associated domain [Verrucomicrobia bacterium]|nr:MAG: SNARE-associated domain [Verrucomicrobiota bacterium]
MQSDENADSRRESRRLLATALVVAGLVVALQFTPLKQWLQEVQTLKAWVANYGWKAHVFFVLGSVGAIALGVPRLMLCGLGGVLFGFAEGLIVSQMAGVLGAYGAFLLTRRWAPKQWVERKLAGSDSLRRLLAHPSVGTIFVARQLPVPGIIPNVLLGVVGTRHSTFLIGTFLGYLPSNIPIALAGSSMGKESLQRAILQVSLSMSALAVFSVLIFWIRRRLKV